jgi:hypothetical protein
VTSPLRLPLRSPAWFLVPIVLVRTAGLVFGAVNIDECDFLLSGKHIAAGELPYIGFTLQKPLLAFFFYAPVALTGFHMWLMQLIGAGWIVATSLVVAKAARAWTGRDETGWAAGWLACLAQVACVPSVNCELMLNLPAAGALLYYVRAEKSGRLRHDLATGVLIGLAALFKHQAGIQLVSMLAAYAWQRDRFVPRAAAVSAGFAAPWALAAGAYAATGHFAAFYEWNVTRNLAYQAHGAGSVLERLAGGVVIGMVLAAPLVWVLAARETAALARTARTPGADPIRAGLVLTLWLIFVPVSVGGRFYDHYFIQFAPVLALLAAPRAVAILEGWPSLAPRLRWLVLFALALPVVSFFFVAWGGGLLGRFPLQEPRTRELAAWIKANSAPSERMFVWGHFTPIYVLAERMPGTRYFNTAIHVGDFDPHHLPEGFDLRPYVSQRDVDATLHDLDANRPALFVDTAPSDIHEWHRVPLSTVPALEQYLHAHYDLVGRPAGAEVYRRRP